MSSDVWSSKWVFILAAIGAAAGLGNLWRFPYMVYDNGGGAFLLAYLLILFLFGLPLVIMEVGVGQKSQKEVVSTFSQMAGTFGRWVGWLVIGILTLVAGYYAAIIAWGLNFLVASPTMSWGSDAESFFYKHILQLSDTPALADWPVLPIVLGLIATYTLVYFSIFKGLKSVGAVVKWSVPLPFVLLLALLVNSLFLPGASSGLAYLLVPDWSALTELTLWKNALTQAFFSMNIGMGLTILYASFNQQKENIVQSGLYIAFGDAAVSLIAGLAMFGTLGWMATHQNLPIAEVVTSGPTLAFVTFPTALSLLPFGGAFFAVLFFLSILTLAIDSLFAMLETIGASLRSQFNALKRWPQERLTLWLCLVFFLWSLAFAGGSGLYHLDILDHFLFAHLFYITIVLQLILIGWFLPTARLRYFINQTSSKPLPIAFDWLIKWIAPAIFIALYLATFPEELGQNYEDYHTNMILWWGLYPLTLVAGIAWILASKKS